MVLELHKTIKHKTIKRIRDGEKGGGGGGLWRREGEEGDYIPVATLSPPE